MKLPPQHRTYATLLAAQLGVASHTLALPASAEPSARERSGVGAAAAASPTTASSAAPTDPRAHAGDRRAQPSPDPAQDLRRAAEPSGAAAPTEPSGTAAGTVPSRDAGESEAAEPGAATTAGSTPSDAAPRSHAGPSARAEPAAKPATPGPPMPHGHHHEPSAPYDGPPTLFGHHRPKLGGYGGVTVGYTALGHGDGLLLGGEGALLIDHRLALGGAGFGILNRVEVPPATDGTASRLGVGYGGVLVRYHFFTHSLIYASVGAVVGAGGLAFMHPSSWATMPGFEDRDTFFVAEPQVTGHVNFTRFMRLGVVVGYRFVRGVQARGLGDADLRGVTAALQVQFGWL